MKLKKVITGLLASVMVFSSVVSGMPITAAGAEPSGKSGTESGSDLGTDGQGYHEVTHGKRVMVSEARGTSNGGAEILGVNPVNDRYWMGAQLKPFEWDENEDSGYFSDPQWLVIDLGYKQTEFTSIALSYQAKGWPTKGRIETSDDTEDWRTVTEINRASSTNEIGTATYSLPEDHPGTLDRFVRFYFEEVNAEANGLRTVALQSIKIWGKHTGDREESILATGITISTDEGSGSIISGDKLTVDMSKTSSVPLRIIKTPTNSSRKLIKWSSSNKEVIKIEANSLRATLKPMSVGRSYVTAILAADESIKHTIEVNVVDGEKTNVIAGNQTAVMSVSNENAADYLTDSYVDEWHRWHYEVSSAPTKDTPVTMTMDLGRNGTEFDEVRISYFSNESPKTYMIETSLSADGPWYTVADIEKTEHSGGYTIDSLTLNGLTVMNANGTIQKKVKMSEQCILDNHFRRYIRLSITGPNTDNKNQGGIKEFEIIGTQSDTIPPIPVQANGFSLDKDSVNLTGKGATQTVKPIVTPSNATNKNMTWESDNKNVATVDKNGTITAVGKGTAHITVKSVSNSRLPAQTVTVNVNMPMITFDANEGQFADGKNTKIVEVNERMKAAEPEKPKKENAKFIGWFTSKEAGQMVSFPNGVSDGEYKADTTFYAHWDNGQTEEPEPEIKKLTFDANGGSFDGDISTVDVVMEEDGRVKKPENPTRTGYSFVAWYDAAENGNEVKFDPDGLSVNSQTGITTLYADWILRDDRPIETVKMVTFHANGGRFTLEGTDGNYEKEQYDVDIVGNGIVTKPTDPKYSGYTFEGWFTDKSGGEQKYTGDKTTEQFTDKITLYAHWTRDPYIQLTPSEGFELEIGSTKEITAEVYPADATVSWQSGNGSIATVAPKGGNTTNATVTAVKKGNTAVTAAITVEGGTLSGSINVEVTPHYITFEATDGVFEGNIKTQLVEIDSDGKVTKPAVDPTRRGFTFIGWFTQEKDGTKVGFNEMTGISTDTYDRPATFYAHWDKDPSVEITFDPVGGIFSDSEKPTAEGKVIRKTDDRNKVIAPTAPTKEGYVFDHWYKKGDNDTEVKVDFNPEDSILVDKLTEATTLYAHWTPTVIITFNANGGTFAENKPAFERTIRKGENVKQPEEKPSKGTDRFVGWFDAEKDGNEVVIGDDGISTEDIPATTLYAHWQETVEIIYDANGGTFGKDETTEEDITTDKVRTDKGSSTILPKQNPTNGTAKFAGWFTDKKDGTEVTFDQEGFSDIPFSEATTTLYAHWTVTITFDANGGTFGDGQTTVSVSIAKNGTIGDKAPASPSKSGAEFNGWKEENGGEVDLATKTFDTDRKLTAQWKEGGGSEEPAETVTITFDANGGAFADGEAPKKVTIEKNGTVKDQAPAAPVKSGSVFAGWYDKAEADGVQVDLTEKTFDTDTTLYAHWTPEGTTEVPGGDQTPGDTVPTPTPGDTVPTPLPGETVPESEFRTGATEVIKGITYQVLNAEKKTVVVKKGVNKKKVTIPAKVKIKGVSCQVVEIGKKAFKGKKKLKTITIGKNVKTINKNAFQNCKKLQTIKLKGTALKKVKSGAFKKTSSKLTVKAPKKITKSKAKKNKLLKALKKGGNKKVTIK